MNTYNIYVNSEFKMQLIADHLNNALVKYLEMGGRVSLFDRIEAELVELP